MLKINSDKRNVPLLLLINTSVTICPRHFFTGLYCYFYEASTNLPLNSFILHPTQLLTEVT